MKWGGAVATAILFGLWVLSGWYQMALGSGSQWAATVEIGQLNLYWQTAANPGRRWGGIERRRQYPNGPTMLYYLRWQFDHWNFPASKPGGSSTDLFCFPLWAPTAGLAAMTCAAWMIDRRETRRRAKGLCPNCSYPRTGLAPGAVCPECGSAAPVSAALPTKDI